MIQAILIDFDGTIVDSLYPALDAYNVVAARQRLPLIEKNEVPLLRKEENMHILFAKIKIRKYRIPFLARSVRQELRKNLHKITIHTGMERAIENLSRTYALYIVSSNSQSIIEEYLSLSTSHKITPYIKGLFSYTSILGKARLIRSVLRKLALQPHEVIYLGDEFRDILACKEVGVPIISVTWGFTDVSVLKNNNRQIANSAEDVVRLISQISKVTK